MSILEYVYEYWIMFMSLLWSIFMSIGVCLLVYWSMNISILEYAC